MKHALFSKCTGILVLALAVAGCSGDGTGSTDDLGALVDNFIANFSNQWSVDKGDVSGAFFFLSEDVDSSAKSGKLEGHNDLDVYTGSFHKLEVQLHCLSNDELNTAENTSGLENGPLQGRTYKGVLDTLSIHPLLIMRLKNVATPFDSWVLRQHA